MPFPIVALGIGISLAAFAIASSCSSSSSSSSSGSSRRTETDHDAIKAQRDQAEKQRHARMREDIRHNVAQALHSLGGDNSLTAADVSVLSDSVLLKPAVNQPGEMLMKQLNQHKLGSKMQRRLLGHLMTKRPDKVARLPVLADELNQLSNSAQLCKELQSLKAQLAQAGQVNH
ncbi:hypothetical protein P0F23_000963 [Vibrio metschnikovii]|nr:hypothetical protein [Vibrio metschnikovii]